MSQENLEIWRAQLERQREALSAGASPEDTISEMAKIWDPEVELDASGAAVLDIDGLYKGRRSGSTVLAGVVFGLGRRSTSTTSWSLPVTTW